MIQMNFQHNPFINSIYKHSLCLNIVCLLKRKGNTYLVCQNLLNQKLLQNQQKTYAMTFNCMITLKNFAISNAKKTYLNKNYQGMQKYLSTCIVSLQNPRQ